MSQPRPWPCFTPPCECQSGFSSRPSSNDSSRDKSSWRRRQLHVGRRRGAFLNRQSVRAPEQAGSFGANRTRFSGADSRRLHIRRGGSIYPRQTSSLSSPGPKNRRKPSRSKIPTAASGTNLARKLISPSPGCKNFGRPPKKPRIRFQKTQYETVCGQERLPIRLLRPTVSLHLVNGK